MSNCKSDLFEIICFPYSRCSMETNYYTALRLQLHDQWIYYKISYQRCIEKYWTQILSDTTHVVRGHEEVITRSGSARMTINVCGNFRDQSRWEALPAERSGHNGIPSNAGVSTTMTWPDRGQAEWLLTFWTGWRLGGGGGGALYISMRNGNCFCGLWSLQLS